MLAFTRDRLALFEIKSSVNKAKESLSKIKHPGDRQPLMRGLIMSFVFCCQYFLLEGEFFFKANLPASDSQLHRLH